MGHHDFKIGDRVKFKDPTHARSWFLKESEGFIIGITRYGPSEPMITARFGARSAHVAGCFFERVDG
jgi:hypothetical protein